MQSVASQTTSPLSFRDVVKLLNLQRIPLAPLVPIICFVYVHLPPNQLSVLYTMSDTFPHPSRAISFSVLINFSTNVDDNVEGSLRKGSLRAIFFLAAVAIEARLALEINDFADVKGHFARLGRLVGLFDETVRARLDALFHVLQKRRAAVICAATGLGRQWRFSLRRLLQRDTEGVV